MKLKCAAARLWIEGPKSRRAITTGQLYFRRGLPTAIEAVEAYLRDLQTLQCGPKSKRP